MPPPEPSAATRCLQRLATALVAVWRGDQPALAAAVAAARAADQPRAELEETLLQAVLFCGFPRVVSAFETLQAAWPVAVAPAGGGLPPADWPTAGRALFAAIYGRNDQAVRQLLGTFHQEFHDFVLEAAYGRILTRPGLDPRTRELLAIGVLAAMDQPRQFVAHARGALHFGADRQALHEVLVAVFGDGPEAAAWLQRVKA